MSPWVATFVGEANVLDASFGADGADTAIGRVPSTLTTGVGHVLCRPEQLRLVPVGPATVSVTSYFGRDTRYEVDVPGAGALVVRSAGPPEHEPGDAVTVRYVAEAAHAWPATEH